MSDSTEYEIWTSMKKRCSNPRANAFKHYGGRGIVVCDEWLISFEAFFRDMGPRPSLGHTLERVNNNGPYSKENCKWATWVEQNNNHRDNHRITFNEQTKTLTEWARLTGLTWRSILHRLERKWTITDAIMTPRLNHLTRSTNRHLTMDGTTRCLSEWSTQTGIGSETIAARLRSGWPIARALTTPARHWRRSA